MIKDKKVALVTGCNGGIGNATCDWFINKGWHVIGVDKRNINQTKDNYSFIHFDIERIEAIPELLNQVKEITNHLESIINNAALQKCKPFEQITIEDWNSVLNVNMAAPFFLAQNLYGLLKVNKGSVVNVSSVHAVTTSREILAYASSKGGLATLTRAMAIEFAPDSIRVNAILPGAVDTSMLRSGLTRGHVEGSNEEELVRALGLRHIIGRVGKPEEIAKAIFFMADNENSSFITGQSLIVDGGATIMLSTEK